jgi:hypothetical protein
LRAYGTYLLDVGGGQYYVKMDLREIDWAGMDWIDLAQDRDQCRTLVNTVMNLSGPIKCWEVLE